MGEKLYTIKDVESLSADTLVSLNQTHVNQGLTQLLTTLGCANVFTEAEGCRIRDNLNQEYIDFIGAYGVMNVGNNNAHILDALNRVRNKIKLVHIGINPYEAVLAHNLSKVTKDKLSRVFFCNSGSEAVESAIKMARAATGKSRIVYCEQSYHGKSIGALSVTGREYYQKAFVPIMPDTVGIPYDDLGALEEKLKEGAGAFIVEPIQGEAGINTPSKGYLKEARRLCDTYGVLMILDEVQTGLGRTGTFFAYEQEEIVPDILCLAKALSGGVVPIGACLSKDDIYQKAYGSMETCMLHSSTFGGNTFACAAGIATLNYIEENALIENCREKGAYLLEGLQKIKEDYYGLKEVRGKGLMLAIEFDDDENIHKRMNIPEGQLSLGTFIAVKLIREYHIITAYSTNNANVIRLEPALIITKEEIDMLLNALKELLIKKN